MAAGKMSWQYHNQKHLPSYGISGGSDGSGDMQDMHLKMSKKIAQLTKVIYALNTKNDEHEAAMSALKDAHEEEMQQLLSETSAKIQQYRLKIGNELDLRKKIKNLEECVHIFEQEKKQALVEIDAHDRILAEREVDREREHELRVHVLTRELLETKAAFEQRISDFESMVTNVEREKHKNMDSVTSDYKRQVDELRAKLLEQQKLALDEKTLLLNSKSISTRKFESEIEKLQEELKKTNEEADVKVEKAKAFYEHELMVLQSSSISNDEMSAKWRERENVLKQEAAKMELSLKNKIKELNNELEIQREEVTHLMQKLNQSKSEANSTLDHIKDLRDQLNRLQKDYDASTIKTKTLTEELKIEKANNETQANDILRKSNIIGTLEAIKLTQQESIHGLEDQMKELRKRLHELEQEKTTLMSSQSDQNSQLVQQLKIMSKKVETLTEEKSALQKQFKRDLEDLKITHEEESEGLKQQFEKEADSMFRNHQAEIDVMKAEAKEAMDKMLVEMKEKLQHETSQFESDKAAAIAKVEAEKDGITLNLQHAQAEIARLNKLIEQHESGLGDASSHISGLKSRINELETDVTTAQSQQQLTEAAVSNLRTELKNVNDANERQVFRLNRNHEEAVEKSKREWDEKWEAEMRKKLSDLEQRLLNQHLEERLAALQDLELRKNRQLEASKAGWEEQIKQLSSQMSELRLSFDAERRDLERKLEASLTDVTDVERKLRNEAEQTVNEFKMKMDHRNESHEMALVALEQRKDEEIKSLQNRLDSQHREEMHSQLRSQQIAVEGVKDKMNREKREEVEKREQEFQQDMNELRSELTHQQAMALDDVRRQYEHQIVAAKSELEQMMSAKARNEEKLSQRMSDLETDLQLAAADNTKVRDKVTEQNEMLATLNKELDQKGKEILRVRSEANMELRHRDEELTRKFQSLQDNQEAGFIRQKQNMVYEFNKATEALKDKISSLSIALYQTEEKYERRESRPEDLDAINQLKALVRDREEQVQKLIDDKKFYQMELVNRETNFNKVFTSSPNVGVLDPRSKKKKSGGNPSAPPRFSSQFVSVPNLNSIETALNGSNRLEPLRTGSNSPSSYNKPLQPTPPSHPKKFIRNENGNSDKLVSKITSNDVTLQNLHSNKFMKLSEQQVPEPKVVQDLGAPVVEEQYDNVGLEEDAISCVSDMDVFSQNASLALNGFPNPWSSETDLFSAIDHPTGRIDLCTSEPISMPSHCASLPNHYYRPRPAKAGRKMLKTSIISALKPKRK